MRAQAERLLDDPRARAALVRFFRDFMNLGKLDALDKNAGQVPQFSATLGPSMRVEIERMFENVVFEKEGDFRDLFTTRDTYVNEELARVYGIEGITGPDWTPVTLPDDGKRAGVLTTAGFLAMNAHKTQTSPTHRGRFVRLNLLCQDIPPPPPGVDTTLPEPDPSKPTTLRQRLDVHRTSPECAGCHEQMDPIGFAFERLRRDRRVPRRRREWAADRLDDAMVEGTPIAGPVDMAELVAQLPEVGACIARRFYEHAGAHLAGKGDEGSVEELVTDFVASDYDFKDLVLALVTNDGYPLRDEALRAGRASPMSARVRMPIRRRVPAWHAGRRRGRRGPARSSSHAERPRRRLRRRRRDPDPLRPVVLRQRRPPALVDAAHRGARLDRARGLRRSRRCCRYKDYVSVVSGLSVKTPRHPHHSGMSAVCSRRPAPQDRRRARHDRLDDEVPERRSGRRGALPVASRRRRTARSRRR